MKPLQEDMLEAITRILKRGVAACVEQAVTAEREACARVADRFGSEHAEAIAARIRARKSFESDR